MDSKQILDFMMRSKIFSGFSAEECVLLEKTLNPYEKFFEKKEIVYNEDDEITCIGQILQGRLIGEKYNSNGQAHIVHIFDKMDVIGLETIYSTKQRSPVTFIANTGTVMLMFPFLTSKNQEQIPTVFQIRIRDNMMRIFADENIKSLYKLEVLSKRALRCRIRTFLCIMEKKTGKRTFHIGMDREQFAQYLCVSRSALSNELSQMQKEGMIAFKKDLFTLLRI